MAFNFELSLNLVNKVNANISLNSFVKIISEVSIIVPSLLIIDIFPDAVALSKDLSYLTISALIVSFSDLMTTFPLAIIKF